MKMLRWLNSFVFVLVASLLFGCTPSLVYSPSINLPSEPLEGGQFQITGGIGMLPEVRPREQGRKVTAGREITIRYSPFDHFTLQIKGWRDRSNDQTTEDERSGLSYSNIIMLNTRNALVRIGLIPRGAFLFVNKDLAGAGGVVHLAFWLPEYKSIRPYIALGAGFGIRNMARENHQWGWGYITNIGLATTMAKYITLNLEISAIKQINEYENISHFILAPSFNIGFQI